MAFINLQFELAMGSTHLLAGHRMPKTLRVLDFMMRDALKKSTYEQGGCTLRGKGQG